MGESCEYIQKCPNCRCNGAHIDRVSVYVFWCRNCEWMFNALPLM